MTPKRVVLSVVLAIGFLDVFGVVTLGSLWLGRVVERDHQASLNAPHPAPSLQTTMDSYVRVVDSGGEGSGTEGVYEGRVYVLTAAHVVGNSQGVTITKDGLGSRLAAVVATCPRRDLALLWVRGPRPHNRLPSLVPSDSLTQGEECVYTSNGAGLDGYTERSLIAKTRHNPHPHISHEIPGCPLVTLVTGKGFYGSSGCGVFVKRANGYRLAGVISHWAARAPGAVPLAAISPDDIRDFLNDATH